jgi:hypothetical protein
MTTLNEYMRRQLLSETATFWLGNSNPDGMPDMVRLSGLRVAPDHQHLDLYVGVPFGRVMLDQLAPGSKLSMLYADVHSYRSFQCKGPCVSCHPSTDEEVAFQRTYVEKFCRGIGRQGFDWEALFSVFFRQPSMTVIMRVEAMYEQTPKAGTGEQICT